MAEVRAVQLVKTEVKTIQERLEWTLDRQIIVSAQESQTSLTSPNYDFDLDQNNTSWYLEIEFDEEEEATLLSAYLFLETKNVTNSENIKTDMKFSIKTQDGTLTKTRDVEVCMLKEMEDGYGVYDYLKTEELPMLYINEKLTVVCDLVFTIENNEKIRNDTDKQIKYYKEETETDFEENIKRFYKLGLFSDLVIFCGDQKFLVHKLVLASRSDIFSEMLQNVDGELEITDTSPDFFKMLVDNIYSKKIPENIELVAGELFPLATKYNLKNLAKACEVSLLGQLTDANALETLAKMDQHNATAAAKDDVIKYIVINAKEIIDTQKFKDFSKEQPELMIEIFRCSVVQHKTQILPTGRAEGTAD